MMEAPSFSVATLPTPQHLTQTTHSSSPNPSTSNTTARKETPNSEESEDACRHCGSRSLRVDWAQGDRVCTRCGLVADEKLLDDRPEWREFNEAEDLAKGAPAAARCGMVPVDESRYLGGLQPTSLTKHPFGNNGPNSNGSGARMATLRKKLLSTNRKLDHMMGQRHARALKNARVSRLVRKRQLMEGDITDQSDLDSVVTEDDDVRPEIEQMLIQEEEDANRMQTTLNADKWSLRRAILLFEKHESLDNSNTERDDLQQRLDSKLRKAAADLYRAYQMLLEASRRLQLPDRVIHEATDNLCRYVARRDGFAVKGVASRLTLKKNNLSVTQQKQAAESLREHNKLKQMGSLCAALLLLTARKLGWPRPLTEVCGAVQPAFSARHGAPDESAAFIKAKHCSRAMDEVKKSLPDFARSLVHAPTTANSASGARNQGTDPAATVNFVDHKIRKLLLPPVAEASIRALVWHCAQEQQATGQHSGTKLTTICASVAFFVCLSGSVMQQLASQAQVRERNHDSRKRKSRFVFAKKNSMAPPPPKLPKLIHIKDESPSVKTDSEKNSQIEKVTTITTTTTNDDDEFDVFSHKVGSEWMAQKKEYEMRRIWDAWAEQTAWLRSLSEVEHSSGVSSHTILSHYKANIFPRRQALLEYLRGAVAVGEPNEAASTGNATINTLETATNLLMETPLASVLLSHVVAAAPLLNPTGKRAMSRS